jgi:hypothetical protein
MQPDMVQKRHAHTCTLRVWQGQRTITGFFQRCTDQQFYVGCGTARWPTLGAREVVKGERDDLRRAQRAGGIYRLGGRGEKAYRAGLPARSRRIS